MQTIKVDVPKCKQYGVSPVTKTDARSPPRQVNKYPEKEHDALSNGDNERET
jgi:hypothetical protein